MNNIVVIGMTGEGKSEIVKKMIEGKQCLVFDLNDEYGTITKYPGQKPCLLSDREGSTRRRYIRGDMEGFIQEAGKVTNSIVVFEEATGFIEGRVGRELKRLVVNKMFTKNVYVFLFHSIADVPPFIMRLTNFVVLFKTNDEEYVVEKKYPRILPYFRKLKKAKKGANVKIKLI